MMSYHLASTTRESHNCRECCGWMHTLHVSTDFLTVSLATLTCNVLGLQVTVKPVRLEDATKANPTQLFHAGIIEQAKSLEDLWAM